MKEFMRKMMIGIIIAAIMFGSAVSIWLYFYHQQKSPDNLPSLQLMKDYLTEKGEVYASEKIVRYDRDTLAMVWGDPVGELSGMDGQIWQVDDTASIVIYFDGDTATNTKILWHDEANGSGLEIEALDAIVPALKVDGEVYYLAGESYFGVRCGVMDGSITSTVERWEMPTKDDQSNFGEYDYQYGNKGFIEVLQNGNWYSYGTRSDKGRVYYDGWWYDMAYISEETLEWLAWYNEQPEEVKELAYVPAELRDPYHLAGTAQLELDARKQAVHDALYHLEYNNTASDILQEYEIEFAGGDSFGISEIEMMVWKDGKAATLPQELYEEMYDIGLLEYYQMEDGRWKYRGLIYDQMIEMVGRMPNAVKASRYVVLTNNPEVTFEQIYKSFISSSLSDSLNINETVVVEMGVAE